MAIAWTAVLMMVFEEIEGISRLQAFGVSAAINVCFFLVQLMLTPVTRHLLTYECRHHAGGRPRHS